MADPLRTVKTNDMLEYLTFDGRSWKDDLVTIDGAQILDEWDGGDVAETNAAFCANFTVNETFTRKKNAPPKTETAASLFFPL